MPPTASELVYGDRPLIAAHRGDSRVAPENTLPAFLSALDAGADFIELDYRHSADGVPVVIHDDILDRVTDARSVWPSEPKEIKVGAKTIAELRTLDWGAWYKPEFAGTKLLTLEESLAAITPRACIAIERKAGDPVTLVKLLQRLEMRTRVVVMAFDWKFLSELHDLTSDIILVALGKGPLDDKRVDALHETSATIVNWDDRSLTLPDIGRIHEHGWRSWCWTVDDPQRGEQLLKAGLDGLTTNHPRRMLAVRERLALS